MEYYFITGSSSGLGKALANLALSKGYQVTGMSRRQTIHHENYNHIKLDLSITEQVLNFNFSIPADAKKVVLFNNAGAISEAKPFGKIKNEKIISDFNVNLISPAILINKFIETFQRFSGEKIIVNISSGAGKNPIDGWGVYCSSKSGIDMLSNVIAEEQRLTLKKGFRIYSIAPGIVDTEMQDKIRTASKENFSRINDFISYKERGELSSPALIAEKYISILAEGRINDKVVFSVRDL